MNLKDIVMESISFDCRKHQLADNCDDWAQRKLNAMSNDELLDAISWALETKGILTEDKP